MTRQLLILSCFSLTLFLMACGGPKTGSLLPPLPKETPRTEGYYKVGSPYKIKGRYYRPEESFDLVETGIASWYGPNFHGKQTANGEIFYQNELTAAHRTLQLPSLVRVTNLDNGKSVVLRVNDRGPFARGRIIDVSKRAAELLDFKNQGTAKVRVEVLPRESRKVAQIAKRGESTRGMEVALNKGGREQSIQQAAVSRQISGHQVQGRFYPDPIVTQEPVMPARIFVQAGAFTVKENAIALQQKLQRFGPTALHPVQVRGQRFYRVRVGPASSVANADKLLSSMIGSGYDEAVIVVD